ncbi:hypothetical protein YC2023_076188 [Brassica napus]
MKLDGVYYPLNDSISWLTTCMEEMKQDIARIQHATDVARPPSIDRRQHTSIDRHHHTSIDNQMPTSVDDNPPRPHTMKSQQNFYTREEIDQLQLTTPHSSHISFSHILFSSNYLSRMSSSPSEKKSSDVEMGEDNSALPTPAMQQGTPTFVAGFLSFKERLSRRSAEKEGGRIQPEVSAILSAPAMSTSAGGNKSPGDATPLAESAMVPVQVSEVSDQPSGSSTTLVPAPKEEKTTELMPPPLDRKEIVLGLPASSAAPLPKVVRGLALRSRPSKRGDVPLARKGNPQDLCRNIVPRFFVSLIDGMLSDCGSEIERSTRGLAESREALKQTEAALKSTEAARAAELSQLEVRVSDLERDLGKSASALFKLKKEKKSKASEVHRLQREIQNREESRTVISRDDFHARLTRMAVLFDSLMAVREKDLALASVEGSLNEIHLLEGDIAPTLDSEEARLLSRKEELKASDGDFDSILSQLQFECTLTPCSGETEGQGPVAEEGGDVASGRGNNEATEGGDGCEVEDEGGAPRSA